MIFFIYLKYFYSVLKSLRNYPLWVLWSDPQIKSHHHHHKQNIKFAKIDYATCGEKEILGISVIMAHLRSHLVLFHNPLSEASQFKRNFKQHLKAKIFRKLKTMVGVFNLDWSSNSVLKESFETLKGLN